MKKIIIFIVLCVTMFEMNAQKNYNGWYQNPNPDDVLVSTAISDYSNMNDSCGQYINRFIIDTYQNPDSNWYYLVFTLIDNHFNIIWSHRIDFDSTQTIVKDVIFDVQNCCWVACGSCVRQGMIMAIDLSGNVMWKKGGQDTSNNPVASNYRRITIANNGKYFYYVACGWNDYDTLSNYCKGIVSFFDINGDMLYTFTPNPVFNTDYWSKYMDLQYNICNNKIALVGIYHEYDSLSYDGMLREEIDLSSFQPSPLPIIERFIPNNVINLDVTSITWDTDTCGTYYVGGSTTTVFNTTSLYTAKIDAFGFNITGEAMYNTFGSPSFEVRDITYNPMAIPDKIALTGVCNNYSTSSSYEGFLFELNTNLYSGNNFTLWSGYYNPNTNPPFLNTYFDHIVCRRNDYQASPYNYSFILYGGSDRLNSSYIAEYYPNFDTCQEQLISTFEVGLTPSETNTPSDSIIVSPYYFDRPQYSKYPNRLVYICDKEPSFRDTLIKEKKLNNLSTVVQPNYINESGIIKLDASYKQAICNVYSVDGKLILTKQAGVLSINTQNFKPGIYFLQPINDPKLKAIKFNVIH